MRTRSASTYNVAPLWEPVSYLPTQLPERSCRARLPEVRLLAALFDDAVQCLRRNRHVHRGAGRREFLEARSWVWDDCRAWPFAFLNVCDVLGLDPLAVRHRLRIFVATSGIEAEPPARQPPGLMPRGRGDTATFPRPTTDQASERDRFAVVVWDEV